jgi:hypothetical protein
MTSRQFTGWRKPRRSDSGDNCVEVGRASDGTVGVRDSKDRGGPLLEFTPEAWRRLTDGVRSGAFDQTIRVSDDTGPTSAVSHAVRHCTTPLSDANPARHEPGLLR